MRPRLLTIPLSHYCERARWALDAAGVDYVEEQHLQAFAGRKSRRLGATGTVPVLLAPCGLLPDSGDIVRWASERADDRLYPRTVGRAEIEGLQSRFAGRYGVETRRLAYDWFFRNLDVCLPYNAAAAPRYQERLLRWMKALIAPQMTKKLGLGEEQLSAARSHVLEVMDEVAHRLADERPYLTGDTFTAADLTFAAMTAICVIPDRYGVPLPRPADLDSPARQWIARARQHPAGRFALRLYEQRPRARGSRCREPLPLPEARRAQRSQP